MILLVCTIPMNGERWSMMLAVNSHVLLISGLLISGLSMLIPIFLIILSTTVWVTGILQLRKSMRAWGLVDLLCAVLFSIVFYGGSDFPAPDSPSWAFSSRTRAWDCLMAWTQKRRVHGEWVRVR